MNEQKIQTIISHLTNSTVADLNLSLQQLGVDSLKMMALLVSVEKEFDLIVPDSELVPENFLSGKSILEMVNRLKT